MLKHLKIKFTSLLLKFSVCKPFPRSCHCGLSEICPPPRSRSRPASELIAGRTVFTVSNNDLISCVFMILLQLPKHCIMQDK